jgi:hypothetical protein
MDTILFDPEFEYPRKSHERLELLKINRFHAKCMQALPEHPIFSGYR